MLKDPENNKVALQGAMARIFNQLRCIDFDRATEAVDYFVDADSEALRAYLSTIIYFAELVEHFSEKQKLTFRDLLFHLIEIDSSTKSTIAWHMWKLSNTKSSSGESYLKKTLKYVHKIVKKYDQDAFSSIYSLTRDHINDAECQNELLSVYKKCIAKESQYLRTHPNYPKKMSVPYYRNGEMLVTIFTLNKEDFLWIFKVLSQYPPECYLGDIKNIVDLLFEIPGSLQQDVADIFQNLVERYPGLYEKKKQWEEGKNGHI
jgi:hypothetical protein